MRLWFRSQKARATLRLYRSVIFRPVLPHSDILNTIQRHKAFFLSPCATIFCPISKSSGVHMSTNCSLFSNALSFAGMSWRSWEWRSMLIIFFYFHFDGKPRDSPARRALAFIFHFAQREASSVVCVGTIGENGHRAVTALRLARLALTQRGRRSLMALTASWHHLQWEIVFHVNDL